MKKIILVGLLSLFLLSSCTVNDRKMNQLEVGQVWLFTTDKDNPFVDQKNIYKQEVIALSGDYVQYIQTSIYGVDTLSCSKRWFVSGAELQK
jgi:hypothetical protein